VEATFAGAVVAPLTAGAAAVGACAVVGVLELD
jgi:hypothetical protein